MEVSEADKWYVDPLLGWRKLIAGGLEIQDIPGNHTTMFSEPNVETLVERLRGCLEKAQETLNR
jgi:thioesterase domain-containing protein